MTDRPAPRPDKLEDVQLTLTVNADQLAGMRRMLEGIALPQCRELIPDGSYTVACNAAATHELYTAERGWLPVCAHHAAAGLERDYVARSSALSRLRFMALRADDRRRRRQDAGDVYSDTVHRLECTNPACGHCR
jgi:hypothetical protein